MIPSMALSFTHPQGTGGSAVYASYGADMDDEKAVVQKNCTVLSIKDVQGEVTGHASH
jgi:hypothetical protein